MTPETVATVLSFNEAGRVPAPGDNVAIATRRLDAGTRILLRHLVFEISHTVLEGHRFAIQRIDKGKQLLSWGLPFGMTLRPIEAGEYICNERILRVLKEREVSFDLPTSANFSDYALPFHLDEARFEPSAQISRHDGNRSFKGFLRGQRGVGTRNYVVLLGTNSRTAPFVRELSRRFKEIKKNFPNVDGVVPIDHTEGGGSETPHNFELTLRTLGGFTVNPNVAAVLAVDAGNEVLSNAALKRYLEEQKYPIDDVVHEFLTTTESYAKSLDKAEKIVRHWLPQINKIERASASLEHLKLGLQCGGSDAFSGVSGNPLVGILARETVAWGGSANLAETDELIGAESYVLEKVKDLETAKAFLQKLDRFQKWAALHGHSAEGNPSGGNLYRGLYNITIKSIGAARKKDPAARLDYVIDFARRMEERGFYFMDSPGNDLESIAGQAAAGCNMVLFATGNGSITNFPFVPTIKIMTTTKRFELVRNEMDFNAGRYLDGESLEDLGKEAFDYLIDVASGQPSAGERAGHSQVQLWREWRRDDKSPIPVKPTISGKPVLLKNDIPRATLDETLEKGLLALEKEPQRVALVLPTSLCSGQISLMIAEQLGKAIAKRELNLERAVALPHTEGCGNSAGESEELFMRTMAGYLTHPLVSKALLLEHGCEKTHNDAFRSMLRGLKIPETSLGWASVQLDGGIERVIRKALKWFESSEAGKRTEIPFGIAFVTRNIPEKIQNAFELLGNAVLHRDGVVVIPHESDLWKRRNRTGVSLDYGQRYETPGSHSMFCPTEDASEIVTGLGATGVRWIMGYDENGLLSGNPLVPTIQVSNKEQKDVDLVVNENDESRVIAQNLLRLMIDIQTGKNLPASEILDNTAFQITRGWTGISL